MTLQMVPPGCCPHGTELLVRIVAGQTTELRLSIPSPTSLNFQLFQEATVENRRERYLKSRFQVATDWNVTHI
jgi:hypothetical protein